MNIFEFLHLDPNNTKVHLAVDNSSEGDDSNPLDVFFDGRFKEWQEQQTRKNFGRDFIISLIKKSGSDEWMFAGVYKVIGLKDGSSSKYLYETEICDNGYQFVGRLLIEHKRQGRNSYINGENFSNSCSIYSILPNRLVCADFKSFKEVLLNRNQLEQIFKHQNPAWQAALSSVSGVYLISDTKNGKLYVGSAYGEHGIWGRWETYAKNLHGDVKLLVKIFNEKGKEYFSNFQYSILETFDVGLSKEEVISIEMRWKKVLLSKEFGYNEN